MTEETAGGEKKRRGAAADGITRPSWAARDVIRSVTGRKGAEEALRESEERWRSLVESVPDVIMTVDADGTILFINRTVLGFTVEGAIGSKVYDYVPPEHHDTMRKRLEAVFEMGEAHDFEIGGAGPFGRTSWYFNRIGPVVRDGRVVAATLVATDITERRQAEEALRESEERYRDLVENISDVIFALDADGRLTYISPVVTDISGYSPSEMVGRPFTDFVDPDDVPSAMERFRRSLSGEDEPIELRFVSKSGEVHWLRSSGRPILDGDRVVGLRGVQTDITERKLAEEALRESEERYRDLAENLNDAIFELDTSGRITYVSPGMEEVSGYSPSEMIGRPTTDFLHPDDLAALTDMVRKRPFGHREPSEYRLVTKSGEARWVRSLGQPVFEGDRAVGFRGVLTDITEHKRAEEALRESEERFRQVAATAGEWISEIDAEGRFTFSSPAVKEILGYEPEEVIGKHFYDFYPAEEREQLLAGARRIGAGKKAYSRAIARNVHKEGRTVVVESSGLPILDAEGNVLGYRNVARDITERKRAEEALRESEEKYRDLVENVNDVIYELDEEGRVSYISPVAEEVGGYSPSEIVGRPFTEFIHPGDVEALAERFRKALAGDPKPIEYRLPLKSGEIRWYRSFGRPILEGERIVGFRGVQTDITERRVAEEALRESEARLRAFANAVPDIAFILDENGVYVEVLAASEAKDLLYANGDTTRGRRLHDVLPKKSADQFLSVVRKTIETQEAQVVEYVLQVQAGRRWFEGRTAPLSLPGEKQMVVWVSHDITERKLAETERQKAREELDRKADRLAQRGNTYRLTFRELAVLDLVSAGKSDREIANLLGIRPRTVSKHVENIRAKMGASSRTEAGVRAIREELLS